MTSITVIFSLGLVAWKARSFWVLHSAASTQKKNKPVSLQGERAVDTSEQQGQLQSCGGALLLILQEGAEGTTLS